jgi:Mor family transcriptional regulator
MKLTANVRTVMVKQFVNGATIAELARTWPFQPTAIEAVLRKRLKFHETNGHIVDAEPNTDQQLQQVKDALNAKD